MDVFGLRDRVISDYSDYVRSFIRIKDEAIHAYVDEQLGQGRLWPDPLVQLNPSFEPGGTVEELAARGVLADECRRIFRRGKSAGGSGIPLHLHRHQQEAVELAATGKSYVLTTGTGSGKSLAYFIPIVDHVLRRGSGQGIKAIVVYPMNALCNSQMEELKKYLQVGYPDGGEPVRFARYTGQETDDERLKIASRPPDILLTNYMMLELLLTRPDEGDRKVTEAAAGLEFLVLDELHTYRGRQGADVAMLVRRVRERCGASTMRCVGTSATMATGGTREERQAEVARVASVLFGETVAPEHVIGETLQRAVTRPEPALTELQAALQRPPIYPPHFGVLSQHPLAAWTERTFGLAEDAQGRLERRKPISIRKATEQLAAETSAGAETCRAHLQELLLAGFQCQKPDTGLPLFAFRLHQFVSRGDAVYGTIEPRASRQLYMEGQVYAPGDREKRLYPMVFCRECGQEFFVVDLRKRTDLIPRELRAISREEEVTSGYLMPDPEEQLAADPDGRLDLQANNELLPEDWLETGKDGEPRVKSANRKWLPHRHYVRPDGTAAADAASDGMAAWFMPAPFRFCPSCGITYSSASKSDFGKLAGLATEGRSTATTIFSLTIVRELRKLEGLDPAARKLLSFTDNRQDASLQAGHFNDFIQIGLLRGALYAAVAGAGESGLTYELIARAVVEALGLDFPEYASNPDARFLARDHTNRALADVIGYRIYRDLRRGWRVTAPNLEQCGLLRVRYDGLDELCAADDEWQKTGHEILAKATIEERLRVCQTVLDTMRRELAIKVRYLDKTDQEGIASHSFQYLREPWALEEGEEMEPAPVFCVGPAEKSSRYGVEVGVSSRGGLGQYLRRSSTWRSVLPSGKQLPAAEVERLADGIFSALVTGGQVEPIGGERGGRKVYRLQAGCIRWLAGDGTPPEPDPVRTPRGASIPSETNAFFRDFYCTVARGLRGIEAREHTAQVPNEVRQERERRFRDGDLPVLYCSPTMELGVDIASLNAVNMRNVPPTPANYAQRSGRAGRSGQPALVLTYCSSNSPHDQYFFRCPELMVAGAVTPPRIDLGNEDLVRAHIQAVWLAETRARLGSSVSDVLDLEAGPPHFPVRESVAVDLRNQRALQQATRRCERILERMEHDLREADWYREDWLGRVMGEAFQEFDRACNRWRRLYAAASQQRDRQHAIVADASTGPEQRTAATRLRDEAQTQLNLLTDRADTILSDFYSYRYFASEGFLPGYSFPRLPLAAYLPGYRKKKDRDEFISRPRFLAVSEFGPRSIIYHEGTRFRVNRVILPLQESGERTTRAKLCGACGYAHFGADAEYDRCQYCDNLLQGHGEGVLNFQSLFRLDNVATRRVDRITSDEEERQRLGYEIKTAVRFSETADGLSFRRAEYVEKVDGRSSAEPAPAPVARATYAPTATLWRLNLGWNRRRDKSIFGFMLDMERGYWARSEAEPGAEESDRDDAPQQAPMTRVVPYVEDRRNALILQFAEVTEADVLTSVQYALKRGIQAYYQLEDSELAAEPLPSDEDRRMILFYEAAEGGAGVLTRLVHDPDAMANVARAALEICHFDPGSGEDRLRAEGANEDCEAACYHCLLSYGNQRDHDQLDRKKARDVLLRLQSVTARTGGGGKNRQDLLDELIALSGSELERDFLRFLDRSGYRLPDRAQALMTDFGTRPDFLYNGDLSACLYVDGPPHRFPDRQARDAGITRRLEDAGYLVIRVQGEESWPGAAEQFNWVFGKGEKG